MTPRISDVLSLWLDASVLLGVVEQHYLKKVFRPTFKVYNHFGRTSCLLTSLVESP